MKIIAAALAALTVLALPALAQTRSRETPFSHFYVIGEFDYYTDSSNFRGGGGGLGWNFNRYLGVQAGAQFLNSSIKNLGNTGANGSADATVVYGEAKVSLPLADSLSLYGSAGLAYGDTTAHFTTIYAYPYAFSASKDATGYRLGVGAEYWFSRHWGLRAGWHQLNVDGIGSDLGAGIAFRF
jgi:opacity protein-like surface antigen